MLGVRPARRTYLSIDRTQTRHVCVCVGVDVGVCEWSNLCLAFILWNLSVYLSV